MGRSSRRRQKLEKWRWSKESGPSTSTSTPSTLSSDGSCPAAEGRCPEEEEEDESYDEGQGQVVNNNQQEQSTSAAAAASVCPQVEEVDKTTYIGLKTTDGFVFKVDVEVAKCSRTIRNMVNALGIEEGEEDDEMNVIPLASVDGPTFQKILQWGTHHKNDELRDPARETRITELGSWDRAFMKEQETETIFRMINACNFLDIKALLNLCFKTVADMINGRTQEEIRLLFNIENDLTPEEEADLRHENEWCEGMEEGAAHKAGNRTHARHFTA